VHYTNAKPFPVAMDGGILAREEKGNRSSIIWGWLVIINCYPRSAFFLPVAALFLLRVDTSGRSRYLALIMTTGDHRFLKKWVIPNQSSECQHALNSQAD
jgi:hypothetical protein